MNTLLEQKKSEVRETIMKSFGYESTEDMLENLDTTSAIRKGIAEYDDSIEKAVYADTPQNRKLGRVGQEYHRGRKKQQENNNTKYNYNKIMHIADLVEKNADKFVDYMYSEDADEAGITKEVAEAFNHVLYNQNKVKVSRKSFDWSEDEDAEIYKEKMKEKGYRVVDLGENNDTRDFVCFKLPPKK